MLSFVPAKARATPSSHYGASTARPGLAVQCGFQGPRRPGKCIGDTILAWTLAPVLSSPVHILPWASKMGARGQRTPCASGMGTKPSPCPTRSRGAHPPERTRQRPLKEDQCSGQSCSLCPGDDAAPSPQSKDSRLWRSRCGQRARGRGCCRLQRVSLVTAGQPRRAPT